MFRGNIDFASRTRVEGWVYCERLSLVGARVHAFVDDECVGSGVVDLFRQDLVEAGVGDGLGGFNFSISLDEPHDPRTLHIRVEDGNAIIRQPGARLAPADGLDNPKRNVRAGNPESLGWMLGRGWLTEGQFRILHALSVFGVHQQRLGEPVPNTTEHDSYQRQFEPSIREILELLAFTVVSTTVHTGFTEADFALQRRRLHATFPTSPPVIVLSAPRLSCISVVEASHLSASSTRRTAAGGIDYEFGADLLLWINLDCEVRFPAGGINSAVSAFVPSRAVTVLP